MDKNSYNRKDFANNTEVRWCPGCGDYAILAALQRLLAELNQPPEKHVFVSGIGCAGRLPYYMNTYGLHTIHGRATAVATGLKALRDDLTVWVVTGDGDALSIGGNHLIHALRRNVNINILLVNNQVYGLTKGQFSPTSQVGQVTKTSPNGVNNQSLNPLALALSCGATFVARCVDKDPNHLTSVLKKAYEHPGCTFVEIYQDCNIFNRGAFDAFALKTNRTKNTVLLEEGKPLVFGTNGEEALVHHNGEIQRARNVNDRVLKHDPTNFIAAMQLARLSFPKYPIPLGVYYQELRAEFTLKQNINKTLFDLPELYRSRATWKHGVDLKKDDA